MKKERKLLFNILGIAGFLIAWQIFSMLMDNPAVPKLTDIAVALYETVKSSDLFKNIFSTLKLVIWGVLIAFVLGVTTGVICDAVGTIRNLLSPLIEGSRNVAAITLFPLLIVLFGIGDLPRIIVIFWTAFPAIILSTTQGLKDVEQILIEAAQDLGANKFQVFWNVKIPIALPNILNGLRIGMGNGFIAIVVAEMLGASKGLGFMVLWTTQSFKYPATYAYIFIIAIVGGGINYLMNLIIKKIERRN